MSPKHHQPKRVRTRAVIQETPDDSESCDSDGSTSKKKDKKLVFLSRSVLQSVRENPNTTGTMIAYQILDLYRKFSDKVDFKNV
jgi:hypothetical protein